jgi:hypothetical protein
MEIPTIKRQNLSSSPIHQPRKAFRLTRCCLQNMEKSSHPVCPPHFVEPVKWITMSLSFIAERRMRIITCSSLFNALTVISHVLMQDDDQKKKKKNLEI